MKTYIPLSWSSKEVGQPKFNSVNLPLSGLPWIYNAEIPMGCNIEELVNQLESSYNGGYLLRGCKTELVKHMDQKGYEIIRTGAEAIVDLDNLDNFSRSLNDLVVRGSKHGKVQEIALTSSNSLKVSSFINHTPYALKPNLQYLFNKSFDSNTRCFVMKTFEDKWLGVVTVSKQAADCIHTEMILRDRNAPVGVMEFLFFGVMDKLRSEGYKHFSLGEVPFVTPESREENNFGLSVKRSLQEFILFKSGHLLQYAFNYKGLFDFKNKFNPTWEPVYICATPTLPFVSLIDLFYKTGYFNLSRSEFIANFRHYSQISSSVS